MKQEVETVRQSSSKRWLVLSSVISSRTVYALNWFNFGPALVLIAPDLGVDTVGVGLLISSFLLGAGIAQVPAGILASWWGNKNTSQLGMLILSISALGEGLSPNYPTLFVCRLLLGIGAALFFSPAIGVITPFFRAEEEGLVIGLYNAAFSIGGGLGLSVWAILMQSVGWREALVFGGGLGLLFTLVGQIVVPKDRLKDVARSPMTPVLGSRNIWVIALGVIGLWGAIFTSAQKLPQYLTDVRFVPLSLAGILTSTLLFASIFGGPIGGYLSDRFRRRKVFIFLPGLLASLLIILIPPSPVIGLWTLIPMIGFLDAMVFSTMYASASQYPEVGQRYAPLAISVINSAHILGAFAIPIGYAFATSFFGADAGWFFMGGLSLVMMTIILLLEEPFKAGSMRTSVS